MTDREFKELCSLVYRYTGITLSEEKRELTYTRFSKRLKALNMSSFQDYCDIIHSNKNELTNFTNAITTNLTSFYRESHHFDSLREKVIPQLLKTNKSKRIRIWSSGCSTGEEPYTIAFTVLQCVPDLQSWDIKILATDVDTDVLSTASAGKYPENRVDSLAKHIKNRWFIKRITNGITEYEVDQQAKKLITFKKFNLISSNWPMHGPFDVIFCRNVVIYFNKSTQKVLLEKYSKLQNKGAYLYMGHSESIGRVTDKYKHVGRTIYIRENMN